MMLQLKSRGSRSALMLAIAVAVILPRTLLAVDNGDCLACHSDKDLSKKTSDGKTRSLFVNEKAFTASVHKKLNCTACHADIAEVPHPDNFAAKPVACAQCHKQQSETYGASVHGLARTAGKLSAATCKDCHDKHEMVPAHEPTSTLYRPHLSVTCGQCHAKEAADYQKSIHGKALAAGRNEAPTCTDCHSEHKIEGLTHASAEKISGEVCGRCHAAEHIATKFNIPSDRVKTYFDSYHGLAARLGSTRAANCASCHGWHAVLPSSDPESTVNPKHLATTCGVCHPNIGSRLATGAIRIHAPSGAADGKPWLVNFISRFYLVIIVLTIGGMLAHNALDYVAKTRAFLRTVKAAGGEVRLTRWMRAQHFALIILFALLAYTGFVHKYPEAWWSWPFHALSNGNYLRGMIHRVCAWLFTGLFLGHIALLLGTRRGRMELRALWLRARDWKELRARVSNNLGRPVTVPPRERFDYVEKSEYWALMWGSAVMIITGMMLIFTELVLNHLPKTWLDVAQVIHFYEAVLATLAIIVWHFYAVIFDPKEYPMNPAWLIGKKPPHSPTQPEPTAPPSANPNPTDTQVE